MGLASHALLLLLPLALATQRYESSRPYEDEVDSAPVRRPLYRAQDRIQLYDDRQGYEPFAFRQQPGAEYQPINSGDNFQPPVGFQPYRPPFGYQPYPGPYQPGPFRRPDAYQPPPFGYQQAPFQQLPNGYRPLPLGYPFPANYQPADNYQPEEYQPEKYQPDRDQPEVENFKPAAYKPVLTAELPFLANGQPFVQQPGVGQHGNRRHELFPKSSYHGNCPEVTTSWQESDSGVAANIRVKRPAPRAASGKNWEVDLIWDAPVSKFEVANGVSEQKAGQAFKVSPMAAATKVPAGEEIQISFKAEFAPNLPRPGLVGVAVNGVYHTCTPGAPKPTAMVKGVRLASHVSWPKKVLGLYVLLADDDEKGYDSQADWDPQLFEWQQQAANVLFFTFIHPETMEVPPSFQKLAASRGTGLPGSVPADTVIMFAIGGYAYSIKPNPWHWLTSKEAAEKMAEKVAEWPDKYGCDGIDLDLEEGAGARHEAGPNMVHFIRRLKELKPNIIISQPTYGYPQVQAEIDVINASWDTEKRSKGLADSVGLMVYEGTQALQYVKNYANGSGQWQGFPVKVNVPTNAILLGAKGSSTSAEITQLARASIDGDLLGIMVWYASVKNGFDYAPYWDASTREDSINGYKAAYQIFKAANGKP